MDYILTPRQERYQRLFKRSLFLTTKYLCGFHEGNVTPIGQPGLDYPMNLRLHGAACNIIQYMDWTRLLFMMPRKYFTSSMLAIGLPIWLIINDYNVRIALAPPNESLGTGFVTAQRKIIKSPFFQATFPNIVKDPNDWAKTSFSVKRDPSFTATESTMTIITPHGATESAHYDWIITTDIVNEDNYKSERQRQEIKDFAHNLPNLLVHPSAHILHEGTTWHIDDWYMECEKNPEYKVFKIPLLDAKGDSTFPEKYTPKLIEKTRNEMTPKEFSANYLLNPISSEDAFLSKYPFLRYNIKTEEGRAIHIIYDESGQEIARYDDPIIGTLAMNDTATKKGKDNDAVVVGSRDNQGRWFIRYGKVANFSAPERLQELELINEGFNPLWIGLEIAAKTEVGGEIGEAAMRGESTVDGKMYEVRPKGETKDNRIRRLELPFSRSTMFFHIGIPDVCLDQVRFYPEYLFDDWVDALAYLLQMAEELHLHPRRGHKGIKNKYAMPYLDAYG